MIDKDKADSMSHYDHSMTKVCDYIDQNLDEELSLDILSLISGFSKYHFHRIFSSYTGVSLIKFIQISRLKRASYKLVFKANMKVIDIAFEAGFESAEAFSRAFKREFGQTPSQFRKQPKWEEWHKKTLTSVAKAKREFSVKVIDFQDTKVAALEHHGKPELHYETSMKFMAWRKESKLSPIQSSHTYGIPYSDPNTVKPEDFRFDLCGTIDQDVPENNYGIITKIIPAGSCAVIRHTGNRDHLSESVYYLYREWLPKNNAECRDFPIFFHYINFSHEVNEHELLTDVHLPIK